MKTLLFALLFINTNSVGQAPKKANVIVIETFLSKDQTFNSFVDYLMDKGWTIERKDIETGSIVTEYRDYSNLNSLMKLQVRIKPNETASEIRMQGHIKISAGVYSTEGDVCNCGMKGSPIKKAFEKMEQISTDYGNPISYLIL